MTKKTLNILSTYVIDPIKWTMKKKARKQKYNQKHLKLKHTHFKIKETKNGANIVLEDDMAYERK